MKAVDDIYGPKGDYKGLFSSHSPKSYDMVKVQRLSPYGRVKPQANGGGKIWPLSNRVIK